MNCLDFLLIRTLERWLIDFIDLVLLRFSLRVFVLSMHYYIIKIYNLIQYLGRIELSSLLITVCDVLSPPLRVLFLIRCFNLLIFPFFISLSVLFAFACVTLSMDLYLYVCNYLALHIFHYFHRYHNWFEVA